MRYIGIVFLIVVLHKTSLAQLQDGFKFKTSICNGKDGGLLPMFGSCRGYYICNGGNAIVGSCDKFTRFNPSTLHCDDANKVDCVYETFDDNDDKNESEDEADDSDFDSESIEDETPLTPRPFLRPVTKPSKLKKPVIELHKLENIKKEILNSPNVEDMCSGKKNGITFPKLDSCSQYYLCKSQKAQLQHCSGQKHFSATLRSCVRPEEAKCSIKVELQQLEDPKSKPAVTAGSCSSDKENALVPHRNDCGKFLLCSNMMFLVMECPVGLHFNAEKIRCDYPKIANCKLQINETKIKKIGSEIRKRKIYKL